MEMAGMLLEEGIRVLLLEGVADVTLASIEREAKAELNFQILAGSEVAVPLGQHQLIFQFSNSSGPLAFEIRLEEKIE